MGKFRNAFPHLHTFRGTVVVCGTVLLRQNVVLLWESSRPAVPMCRSKLTEYNLPKMAMRGSDITQTSCISYCEVCNHLALFRWKAYHLRHAYYLPGNIKLKISAVYVASRLIEARSGTHGNPSFSWKTIRACSHRLGFLCRELPLPFSANRPFLFQIFSL